MSGFAGTDERRSFAVTLSLVSSEGSKMARTPLAREHQARGATLGAYHGAEVPALFTDSRAEHQAVRQAAGLFDFSFRAKLVLTGEHRAKFLHRILSNDIKNLTRGHGTYALLLNAQGHILADLRVYADDDRLWIDTDADLAEKAAAILRRYVIADRVEIEPCQLFSAAVQGPRSREAVLKLFGTRFEPLEQEMDHRPMDFGGQPARLVKLSSTGEEGYEIWLEPAVAARFWESALAEGAAAGLIPCGIEALESLRIEAGIPRYGPDFGEDTLPLEAGLLNALSFNKGCYIGQEIVERARSRGHVNWKLVGLRLDAGAPMPKPGDTLIADGKPVGEVTSACLSVTFGAPLCLAYVRREVSEPGATLALPGGTTAKVALTPFYPLK
jgi:glycine cleavage system T protein